MKVCSPRLAALTKFLFVFAIFFALVFAGRFANAQDEAAGQTNPKEKQQDHNKATPDPTPKIATASPAPGQVWVPTSAAVEATVTLPYAELKQLWQAAEAQRLAQEKKSADAEQLKVRPPVASLLRKADYQLQVAEYGQDLLLRAEYVAENLDTEWQSVALLRGGFSLVEVAPQDALVVRCGNGYEILLPPESSSEFSLTLSAASALPAGWWAEHALPEFHPAPATVRRLTVRGFKSEMRLSVAGNQWPVAREDDAKNTPRALPASDDKIDWRVTRVDPGAPGQNTDDADIMPEPVPWQLRSEMFASFDDGRLGFQLRVHAHTDAEQGGRMLHLILPAGARGISAAGENLVRHRELAREKPTDPRLLEMLWSNHDQIEREFTVEFELAQSPLAAQWGLPLLRSNPPAEDSASLAVVKVNEGLEISGDGIRSASATAGLPKWLADASGGGDFVSMEIAGAAQTVDIRWLPRVDTAPAVIIEARATTRVVDDGALLNHTEYRIEHAAPLNWMLTLPENSELLTASVNGVSARPIQRDDNTLELQIPAPMGTENRESMVRLTYAGSVDSFDPISGSVALELPGTPLFVHRLLWDVAIPDGYETSAIDGNVATDSEREHCKVGDKEHAKEKQESNVPLIKLRKELIRNEAPHVEIFYRSILAGG